MKVSDAVKMYVELRDEQAVLKAAYDAEKAKIEAKMAILEASILKLFTNTGMDSVNTAFGTAFKATTVRASVADRDVFLQFLQKEDNWSLADIRAAKQNIVQYKEAHEGNIPPGISWSEEVVVRVRRPS